jgi:hypothetical protein
MCLFSLGTSSALPVPDVRYRSPAVRDWAVSMIMLTAAIGRVLDMEAGETQSASHITVVLYYRKVRYVLAVGNYHSTGNELLAGVRTYLTYHFAPSAPAPCTARL